MGISTSFKHDKISIKLAAERMPEILNSVAKECNTTRAVLLGKGRAPEVVAVRHILFALLQVAGNSCNTIATFLGLNHSTILHGVARVENNPVLQAEYQAVLLKVLPAMFPLDEALRRVTVRLGAFAGAAFAYLWVDLLGKAVTRTWQAATRLSGLWALLGDLASFTQVREILTAHNEPGALWMLDKHAKQYAPVRI